MLKIVFQSSFFIFLAGNAVGIVACLMLGVDGDRMSAEVYQRFDAAIGAGFLMIACGLAGMGIAWVVDWLLTRRCWV